MLYSEVAKQSLSTPDAGGTLTGKTPPPPPPPKPLHLTMSMRGASDARKGSGYPQMPQWSPEGDQRAAPDSAELDDDGDDLNATLKLKGSLPHFRGYDDDEGVTGSGDWTTAKSRLPGAKSLDDLFGGGSGVGGGAGTEFDEPARKRTARLSTGSASGEGTLRRTKRMSTLRGKPVRTSIFFDPLQPNPLLDPSASPPPPVPQTSTLLTPPDEPAHDPEPTEEDDEHTLDLALAMPAVSLHSFTGEAAFGELSFEGGRALCIEDEDLGGDENSPSVIRSRSIGRNVKVEGIEFEPTDSTPASPGFGGGGSAQFAQMPDWLAEETGKKVMTPILKSEDAKEFFAAVRSPWASSFDLASMIPKEVAPVEDESKEEATPEVSEEAGREEKEEQDVEPASWDALESPHAETPPALPTDDAEEPAVSRSTIFWNPETSRSTLFAVLETDEAEEDDDPTPDTQEAREARWSAAIAQADRGGDAPSPEPDEDVPTPAFPLPLERAPDLPGANVDPPPSLAQRPSTFFERFGMGTIGRGAPAGTLSRSQSFSATARAKGKSALDDWILKGDSSSGGESQRDAMAQTFNIESGPAWKHDAPSFTVHVHSPEKRSSVGKADYTVFQLTTVFSPSPPSDTASASSSTSVDDEGTTVSVERRYSHFALLHAVLLERFPILVIPALPAKTYAGRFQAHFVETRRRDLERWCFRVGRHPVLRCSDEVRGFLAMENENELRNLLVTPATSSGPSERGTSFLNSVYHPEFNIDYSDAQETVDRFERHSKASELGGGVRDVDASIGRVREGLRDTATNLYALAHNLSRLVSGLALPPVSSSEDLDEVEVEDGGAERDRRRAVALGLQNDDGALTWKDSCDESLSTTKAVQATAEAMAAVAELYDANARSTLLPVHELAHESTHPYSQHLGLIQQHRQALLQHDVLTRSRPAQNDPEMQVHEEAVERCETVLNISSAEIERAHAERAEDLRTLAEQLLDGEIAFHEQALEKLRFARSHFDPAAFASLAQTGPRLRSPLERAPAPLAALPTPSTYGVPPSALGALATPVGAVTEAVGSVFRGSTSAVPVVYSKRAAVNHDSEGILIPRLTLRVEHVNGGFTSITHLDVIISREYLKREANKRGSPPGRPSNSVAIRATPDYEPVSLSHALHNLMASSLGALNVLIPDLEEDLLPYLSCWWDPSHQTIVAEGTIDDWIMLQGGNLKIFERKFTIRKVHDPDFFSPMPFPVGRVLPVHIKQKDYNSEIEETLKEHLDTLDRQSRWVDGFNSSVQPLASVAVVLASIQPFLKNDSLSSKVTGSFGIAGAGLAILIVVAGYYTNIIDKRHRKEEIQTWKRFVDENAPSTTKAINLRRSLAPEDERKFFKAETGIKSDEELASHIKVVQAGAYHEVYPYPCIRSFNFCRFRIRRSPIWQEVKARGIKEGNALFLDLGCCWFIEHGYKLFKDTPSTAPAFIIGDIFAPTFFSPVVTESTTSLPPLRTLTTLTPLVHKIRHLHASAFFHLFDEATQLKLAHLVLPLLMPSPGSTIFGSHVGARESGGNSLQRSATLGFAGATFP
ncbi:hypothetical protein RQP46_008626 [Phenoliferia psychrophenolica]